MRGRVELIRLMALHEKSELAFCSACEAGESIKPGAQAPGCEFAFGNRARDSGRKLVTLRLSPVSRAAKHLFRDPGAYAPGFMLSPASQAKSLASNTLAPLN